MEARTEPTFRATAIYTKKAQETSYNIGIELDPPLAKSLIDKCKAGNVAWTSPPEKEGFQAFFLNHAQQRIRVLLNPEKNRIIGLTAKPFVSDQAINHAKNVKMTLNLAMATLILDRIKDGHCTPSEDSPSGTKTCMLELQEYGNIAVTYNPTTGLIVSLLRPRENREDRPEKTHPPLNRIISQHPNATRHASVRSVQRFGIELTQERTQKIVDDLRRRKWIDAFPPRRTGTSTALIEIEEGVQACVVYDQHTMSLITVTPVDRFQAEIKRREMTDARQREQKRAHARNMRRMNE